MKHDLLTDSLLSWRDRHRARRTSTLPGLLAALSTGDVIDFPSVRAHQFHPWAMFLTQLAAVALHRAGSGDFWASEDQWREGLLALTQQRFEPWSLIVTDLSAPAFFQPPVPEGSIDGWRTERCPDNIDVLVTTRNHDVKHSLLRDSRPEMWVYALMSLQTMQGYPGRGYNRIARMKGGYGSRPRVGLMPDHMPAARFRRDVVVLREQWGALLARGFSDTGIALVWAEPWTGETALPIADLSPHFIEVCWRLRLREESGRTICRYTTTSCRRCAPEVDTGDVGDPWAPVSTSDGGVLTIGPSGLDFRVMSRVLCGADFKPAPAQQARAGDTDPILLNVAALARGQGKTEGLHDRTLVLSGPVRRRLGTADGRADIGSRAGAQLDRVTLVRSKVLYPAQKQLTAGEVPAHDDFDQAVNDAFFVHLFENLEKPADDAALMFTRLLEDLAWRDLQRAIDLAPLPDARRYKAISAAEGTFRSCMRRHFPDLSASEQIVKEDT